MVYSSNGALPGSGGRTDRQRKRKRFLYSRNHSFSGVRSTSESGAAARNAAF